MGGERKSDLINWVLVLVLLVEVALLIAALLGPALGRYLTALFP